MQIFSPTLFACVVSTAQVTTEHEQTLVLFFLKLVRIILRKFEKQNERRPPRQQTEMFGLGLKHTERHPPAIITKRKDSPFM